MERSQINEENYLNNDLKTHETDLEVDEVSADGHDQNGGGEIHLAKRLKQESNASPTGFGEQKRRNFLVAQLVDSNDSNVESFQRQVQRNDQSPFAEYQFPAALPGEDNSNPDSLLAKLMQEHEQHQEKKFASSIGPEVSYDADCNNQGAESQQRMGQKAPCDGLEMHKNRSIDLDEHVKLVDLFGIQIVALTINGRERLCLAQISNTLLKDFSYNEIHNRRVALGITCVQCTPIQLEMLRRAGAMPSSSRRCGMITMREAERLCRSFLAEEQPPELPENFYFTVAHRVNYGCKGRFVPARYISSRAKCIECFYCGEFYSPNKFIFHSHKQPDATDCNPPDSPNINSWRKHINLDWTQEHSQEIKYAWEDVKSLFNGGTRRRTSLSGLGLAGFGGDNLSATTSPLDESARKASGESTKIGGRTSNNPGIRKQHSCSKDDANIDVVLCDQRTSLPLSQNERRKLPIGAWPKERQQTNAVNDQSASPFKRSSVAHFNQPYDTLAQQHMKRVPISNSNSGNRSAAKSAMQMPQQQSPLYQHNYPYHSGASNIADIGHHQATTHLASQPHTTTATNSKFDPRSSRNSNDSSLNKTPNQSLGQLAPHAINQANCNQEQLLSMPSSFIYGQLYSQLMQSQLAHQASQRQHRPQVDAQLALRQHIWSSLLANLRCAPNQFEQTGSNLHESKINTSQMSGYCSPNSLSQPQQTSSLLAAAAAAAANSMNDPVASQTPSNPVEPNSLANLPLPTSSGNTNALGNLIPMRMYATTALAQANDMASLFGGVNEGRK